MLANLETPASVSISYIGWDGKSEIAYLRTIFAVVSDANFDSGPR